MGSRKPQWIVMRFTRHATGSHLDVALQVPSPPSKADIRLWTGYVERELNEREVLHWEPQAASWTNKKDVVNKIMGDPFYE